jgi:hypothetical protein
MKKILSLLLLLRFYPMVIGKTLFFGDNYSLLVPGKIFTSYWIQQGIVPLWNPFVLGGISWIGDINQSLFSLSTLFFAVFPVAWALNLTVLTYSALTWIGMYLFAKRQLQSTQAGVLAATLWLFSASVTGSINNISVLQSISFLPWILYTGVYLSKQPYGILATVLTIVLSLLGGYPQYVPYALLLAAVFSFQPNEWQKWLLRWGVIGVIAVGLSAFAWMPFVETLQSSTRSIQTAAQSGAGGLQLTDFISSLLPTFFADPTSGMKWGPGWNDLGATIPYVSWFGLVLFFLVFWQRKQKKMDYLYVCFILGSIFLATTNVLSYLPLFRSSRGPALALVMIDIITSIWIADLSSRIRSIGMPKKWTLLSLAVLIILACTRSVAATSFTSVWNTADVFLNQKLSNSAFHTLQKDYLIATHVLDLGFVHMLFCVCALVAFQKKRFKLLLIILAIEMHVATQSTLFFAPHDIYPSWQQIRAHEPVPERVLITNGNQPYTDFATYWEALRVRHPFSDSYIDEKELLNFSALKRMRDAYTPDWNMVYGVHSLKGYVAFVPLDSNAVWNTKPDDPAINFLPPIKNNDPKLSEWGVSKILVDPFFPADPTNPVTELPKTSRFRLGDGTLISDGNIFETPNMQRIHISGAPEDSVLIVADRYDPNWSATRNGTAVEVRNSSGMRAIDLNAGDNEIVLRYWPKSLSRGVFVSAGTLTATATFVFFSKKRTTV